jgi:hypothetical protein
MAKMKVLSINNIIIHGIYYLDSPATPSYLTKSKGRGLRGNYWFPLKGSQNPS